MTSATSHLYALHNVEHFIFTSIIEATSDEVGAVEWWQQAGLLEGSKCCPGCQQPMRLRVSRKTKHWRCCRKKRHDDGREISLSIQINTWFSGMKLSLALAERLRYAWCMRVSHANTAAIADMSETTVEDWYGYVRCLYSKQLQIGGVGYIVEFDGYHRSGYVWLGSAN
ncbi:hypothetical protein F443_07157 [Phytophthora nicotianae P1569]|uniref:Transposase zinc-ribbon domain-containing protein n=2 Tax=Phytophthora nicotianae TaxID=4792 RepID=V9FEK8_PHYNI|nr:hypothetical protein F443_07157 [Phytophthora nicotianae P1569]